LFDDEKIRGYRGLRVEVYFAAGDLYTYLHISYDQRHDTQFDDIAELLSSKMAAGSITKNLKVFKDHLKKQVEFRPMGDLVATYTLPELSRDDGTGESINYDIYKVLC
jgi:histone acetyltransferase 1